MKIIVELISKCNWINNFFSMFWKDKREKKSSDWSKDGVEERFFNSFDGTRIAYYTVGSGNKTFILVNGLGGTYKAWRHLYNYFKDRFRIISWDYRGTYRSSVPEDSTFLRMEDHVRDALLLCEKEGVSSAIWAGWSMGVQLSLEIYRHAPDLFRALILINGTSGRAFDTAFSWKGSAVVLPFIAEIAKRTALPLSFAGRTVTKWKGFIKLMKKAGIVGETLDEEIFASLAKDFATLDIQSYMTIFKTLGEHDAGDVLSRLDLPVLIIAGEKDPFTPQKAAEKMARRIRGSEISIVPGGTHYVPVEYPELLNLRIEKFLKERGILLPVKQIKQDEQLLDN